MSKFKINQVILIEPDETFSIYSFLSSVYELNLSFSQIYIFGTKKHFQNHFKSYLLPYFLNFLVLDKIISENSQIFLYINSIIDNIFQILSKFISKIKIIEINCNNLKDMKNIFNFFINKKFNLQYKNGLKSIWIQN